MNAPSPLVRLAPITANLVQRNPKILLGGTHQPTLLRYLDGWPRRNHGPAAFLIQFVEDGESLARFANDSFDLAVIQSPSAADAPGNDPAVDPCGPAGIDHAPLRRGLRVRDVHDVDPFLAGRRLDADLGVQGLADQGPCQR